MKFQKFKVNFFYILFRILSAWLIHPLCDLGQSNYQVPFLLNGSNNITNFRIHMKFKKIISSVQSLSRVRLFTTPWIAARQASLSITNSRSSLKFMSIELVMPSSHLIFYCPLLLLPPIPPSIRVLQLVNSFHEVAKVLEFWFSISTSKEHPGLISFRMDWLDLLAVQGTLNSLLQHHSSKESQRWGSLVGCHLWAHTGSDTTKVTYQQQQQIAY